MPVPVVTALSTSPARRPLLIFTVADWRFWLSTSLTAAVDDSVAGVLDAGLASLAVWEALAATVSTGAVGLTVTSSVVLAVLVLPLLLTTVAVAVSVKLTALTVVMVRLDRFQPLTSTDLVAPAVNVWVPSLSVSPTGIALTTSDCSVSPVFTVADSVPSGIAA